MTFEMLLRGDLRFDLGATLFNRRWQSNSVFYWFMIYQNEGFFQYHNGINNINVYTTNNLSIFYGKRFSYVVKINIATSSITFYINGDLIKIKHNYNIDSKRYGL